ncbi:Gp37-like protein [Nocardia tengchongensis]|uniref:Gp37-like protein n=1 Tax=Nocardia tengchongensis TaxID=2055889 RepID=UPI00369BF3E2
MTLPVPVNLTTTNPARIFDKADAAIAAAQPDYSTPAYVVEILDRNGYPLGVADDYLSLEWENNATLGTATLVLKGTDPWAPLFGACERTVVTVLIYDNQGNKVWTGFAHDCDDVDEKGIGTVTAQLLAHAAWFQSFCVYPNFLLPCILQEPKEAIFIGPACTNLKEMWAEQIARYAVTLGLIELLEDILDPLAWLHGIVEGNELPAVVVPLNPLTDSSPWVAIVARMEEIDTLQQPAIKGTGVLPTAVFWKPGDPQPAPEWFTLSSPCIVMDCQDYSNVIGFDAGFLTGLIGEGVALADTALGEIMQVIGVQAAAQQDNNATDPYGNGPLATALGLLAKPAWVVFDADSKFSGIEKCRISSHHPQAWSLIAGGKSPTWVNKGIDLILELAISELLAVLGASGIAPDILNGVFDDVVLAFEPFPDIARQEELGKFARPEKLIAAGSQAFTASTLVAGEQGLWDTRGFRAIELTLTDQRQYMYGRDYGIYTPVSVIRRGVLYTDYVSKVVGKDDRTTRASLVTSVGDSKGQEQPQVKAMRFIDGAQKALNAAMLAQN